MTSPDAAALAAALDLCGMGADMDGKAPSRWSEAIIAALAAQGFRIERADSYAAHRADAAVRAALEGLRAELVTLLGPKDISVQRIDARLGR